MNKYGIIAGGGKLPRILYNYLIKQKKEVHIIGIQNHFEFRKIFSSSNNKKKFFSNAKLGSLGKIIKILKANNINKLIFVGSIKRPSLKDLSLDFEAIKFASNFNLENLGDDKLLRIISKYFEKKGFRFIRWDKLFPDLFATKDFLTKKKPSKYAMENFKVGIKIFNIFGKLDIGQSLIVQNKLVLGLEASEGTDNLIKRCYNYKNRGDKGIVIKLKKHKQDYRFDLPTIGIDTLKLIKKYNYEGIFIQKKFCIIIDANKVINFADKNNIFISTIDPLNTFKTKI